LPPDAGDIAARTAEAGDDALRDGISPHYEHDWDGCGRGLGGDGRRQASGKYDSDRLARELGCERGETIIMTIDPSIFDRDVATCDKTRFGEAIAERR
jgi:hypothetical protein